MNVKRGVTSVLLIVAIAVGGAMLWRSRVSPREGQKTGLAGRMQNPRRNLLNAEHHQFDDPQYARIPDKSQTERNFTWKVGGPTPDGNVVFADWEQGHVFLLSDYGFMLINEGTYAHPKAVYLLGFLKQKKVASFRTLSAFKRALNQIPRGAQVYYHTVCTAGTAPGMPAKTWKDIERTMHQAHLVFNAENHVMYCICGEGSDAYPNVPKDLKASYVRLYGLATFDAHTIEGSNTAAWNEQAK